MTSPLHDLELFCAGRPKESLPTVYRFTQSTHPVMPHAQGDILVIFFPVPIYYMLDHANFNVKPDIFRQLPGKTHFNTRDTG